MNSYVQLEDKSLEKGHGQRRHFWGVWFGVLSTGIVVVLCQMASGGLTPLRTSHEQIAKKDSHPSTILLNTLGESLLKASPFHRTVLDGTTLVKPAQIASPFYTSLISPASHSRLRTAPKIVAGGLSKQKEEQDLYKLHKADAPSLKMPPVVERRAAFLGVVGTAMTPNLAFAADVEEQPKLSKDKVLKPEEMEGGLSPLAKYAEVLTKFSKAKEKVDDDKEKGIDTAKDEKMMNDLQAELDKLEKEMNRDFKNTEAATSA